VGEDKKRAAALAEQARQGYGKDDDHVLAVAQWQLTHPLPGANKGGGRR